MADIASLGLAVDSRPLTQAREQLRGFREDGRGAAESARNFSREIGEAAPRFQDFSASAERVAGSVTQTVNAIEQLIARVTLVSEAMRAAPGAAAEFMRVGTQLDVLARGFATSATGLEMFTRTARDLGMQAGETVSALTRIQAALQGVTAEGQAARRVLENYGVNLAGSASDPGNQARVLREFRTNFARFGADTMSQQEFNAVVPGASLDTQSAFANPSTMSTEQRRRQVEADASVQRAAQQREANLLGVRRADTWNREFADLREQYGRNTLAVFDGYLPDWVTMPFASRNQERRELERRRGEGEFTSEDLRRLSPTTRAWNGPGGLLGTPRSALDNWLLTPEQRARAQEVWNPAAGPGSDGRDRRLAIPVASSVDWEASEEFTAQNQEADILQEEESRSSIFSGVPFSENFNRDMNRRAAIRQQAYVPTLSATDPRLQNPRTRAFALDTERFRRRAALSEGDVERQGTVIAMLGEFGDRNERYADMTAGQILDAQTGIVGGQRRSEIERRLREMDRGENQRGDRAFARTATVVAAGEEGVDLSGYALNDIQGGREGGMMAGMRSQAVMQALLTIEEKFTDAQERRRAVMRAVDTIDQQILERRRLSTRMIEDETRAVEAQSSAIETALRGPRSSGGTAFGPNGEMSVVVDDAAPGSRGLTALGAAQSAALRAAAAREGSPTLSALVRSQGAQVLLQAQQQEAQQRLATDNLAAQGGIFRAQASGEIGAAEAQRQLQALRDQEAVQGLLVRAQVAREAGEARVAEKLLAQAERMKEIAASGRDVAAGVAAAQYEVVTAGRVNEAARLRDVAAGRPTTSPPGTAPADDGSAPARPGGRPYGGPAAALGQDRGAPDYDPEAESRRRLRTIGGAQEIPGGYRAPSGVGGAFAGLPPPTGTVARLTPMGAAAGAARLSEDQRRDDALRNSPEFAAMLGDDAEGKLDALRQRFRVDSQFAGRITARMNGDQGLADSRAAPGRAFSVAAAGMTSDGSPDGRRGLAVQVAQLRALASGASAEGVAFAGAEVSAAQRAAAIEGGMGNIYAATRAGARSVTAAAELRRRRPEDAFAVELDEQVQGEVDAGLPESMRAGRRASLLDQRSGATLRGNASSINDLRQETEQLNAQAEAARRGGVALAELRREQALERELIQGLAQARELEVRAREAAAAGDQAEAQRLGDRARLLRESAQARRDEAKARQEAATAVFVGDERIRQGDDREDLQLRANAPFWRSSERIERDVAAQQYRRQLDRQYPEMSESDRESLIRQQGANAELRETARQSGLLRDSFQQVGASASNALETIIIRGGNARQVVAALVADLASFGMRAASRQAFQAAGNWVSDLLGFGAKAAGMGAGPLGSLANVGGNGNESVFGAMGRVGEEFLPSAQGNVFQHMARGELINAPEWRAMANGGTAAMGEGGPEAVLPLRRGPDGSLGVVAGASGGGGGQVINVAIDASGRSTGRQGGFSQEEMRALATEIGKQVRAANHEENQSQMRLGGQFNPVFGR